MSGKPVNAEIDLRIRDGVPRLAYVGRNPDVKGMVARANREAAAACKEAARQDSEDQRRAGEDDALLSLQATQAALLNFVIATERERASQQQRSLEGEVETLKEQHRHLTKRAETLDELLNGNAGKGKFKSQRLVLRDANGEIERVVEVA